MTELELNNIYSALKFCNENNLKYITLTERELFFKNGTFFSLFNYIY